MFFTFRFNAWVSIITGLLCTMQLFSLNAYGQESDQLKIQSDHQLLISYQGRLTDQSGNPVADGNHTIVFSLYDQESGGTALWKETQNLETSNGVFSAQLGAVNSIDTLTFNRPFYLGIQVDGGDELSPRTRLTTVPYAQRAHSINDSTITTEKLTEDAVTAPKISRRAITTEKFDYGAVDSAAIDPDAVFKTLDPTLEVHPFEEFVGVNRSEPVTGSDYFAVHAPVEFDDTFGGMYISTEGVESWPFYGYTTGSDKSAWHYFDFQAEEWVLEFDFVSPRHRLVVDANSVRPGGDNEVQLGTSNHRWSEVYAANGTIQTSDRRLKTDIESLGYGLQEVLQLTPVSYRWKKEVDAGNKNTDTHLGLIAQQVEPVLSEVVDQPDKEEGYLGMNYSELVPVLIKAVQQQQKQIQALQQKLNQTQTAQKAELKSLKKQVNRLAEKVRGTLDESEEFTSFSK